ncbi:MAG: MoaD/ThiS family protein [Moorellales bacterium]
MAVQIRMHPFHQDLVDGNEIVEVEGKTVGECIAALVKRYPEVKGELLDKHGQLRNFIEVYVNGEPTYPEELEYPVADGDILDIVVIATSG